jgi:hypothetical protein
VEGEGEGEDEDEEEEINEPRWALISQLGRAGKPSVSRK